MSEIVGDGTWFQGLSIWNCLRGIKGHDNDQWHYVTLKVQTSDSNSFRVNISKTGENAMKQRSINLFLNYRNVKRTFLWDKHKCT